MRELQMDFKKYFFCWRSHLSNDDIRFLFVNMYVAFVTASRFKNWYGFSRSGVENDMFWSETGSAFGEPGGTPPPMIFKSTPPPPPPPWCY